MASQSSDGSAATERGLSFGSVAERYERYRLGYPDELVDTVVRYARRPVRSALEVGAGTGKATRVFASRGIEVTALEPDAEMVRVLARMTRGMPVTAVTATLENFETDRRFDLLYAAASWHWTDPVTRWARAVELLAPGGVLALIGRPAEPNDPDLVAAIDEIEKQELHEDDPAVIHPWSIEEMSSTDGLADSAEQSLRCVVTTTAEEFLGRLTTVSAYLVLTPEARAAALRRIRAVLPDRFDIDATVQICMARRV